ncbi:hypothetical protein PV326_000895, partial [Microctonus aethiopoides]
MNISNENYEHAQEVWEKFNINALDPLHYYTAPGLAFDAMLKYTEQLCVNIYHLVDMREELHDLHRDLPLCPQHFISPTGKNTKLSSEISAISMAEKIYRLKYRFAEK